MNKFLYFFIFFLFFLTQKVHAKCNFKTANYIEELKNPSYIDKISVTIPDHKKYIVDSLNAWMDGLKIAESSKKKFIAKVKVDYEFGNCKYKAIAKRHGNSADHITFNDNSLISSLGIKLLEGNIINAVEFILFLPDSRGGLNEVLGSLVYKKLGFISPETFEVEVDLNNVQTVMIFQENSRKEMLERNKRREGPIFRGDESTIKSSNKFINNFKNLNDLSEDVWLSKMSNINWFLKNKTAQNISLAAFYKVQKSYLFYDYNNKFSNIKYHDFLFKSPIKEFKDKFKDFNFLSLAMNGKHGLIAHNRKFLFNSLEEEFEPIYYDGNLRLRENLEENVESLLPLFFENNYSFPFKEKFSEPSFLNNLLSDFSKRVKKYGKKEKKFFYDSISSISKNFVSLEDRLKLINSKTDSFNNYKNARFAYINRITKNQIEQKYIKKFKYDGKKYFIQFEDGQSAIIDQNKFAKILNKNILDGERVVLLTEYGPQEISDKYKEIKIDSLGGKIRFSEGINMDIDEINKTILIYPSSSKDWILFNGVDSNKWQIKYVGIANKLDFEKEESRFNIHGLTGCLNFYNSRFNNTKISVKDSSCEDALNIINSKGNINQLVILNASSDGIDLDFSDLVIDNIFVQNAFNDCLDVSRGYYDLKEAKLINCKDKGFSIGEISKVKANNLNVFSSSIGISVKDFSVLDVINFSSEESSFCIEAKQKKQEFGGSFVRFKNMNCDDDVFIDDNSIIEQI